LPLLGLSFFIIVLVAESHQQYWLTPSDFFSILVKRNGSIAQATHSLRYRQETLDRGEFSGCSAHLQLIQPRISAQ